MNRLQVEINKIKQKTHDYLSFQTLIKSLISYVHKFYILSIEFDQVNYGLVNHRRFKINLILCVLMWLATFYHLLLISSNKLWSLIAGSFQVNHYRLLKSLFMVYLFLSTSIKTDILLEEIKLFKLSVQSPLRIIYYLMNDLKLKHKLTQKNYDKLAFFCRFVQLYILDFGVPIDSICLIGFFFSLFSLQKTSWILDSL